VAGPAVALLLFMLPLGWEQENAVLNRLQGLATRSSVFALQTLTGEAYREGNVIYVGETQTGIVGSSSRIRLAPVVMALAAAVALTLRRPWWERLVLFLSGPAIVLVVNVFRLTLAGMLHAWEAPSLADWVLRDPGAALMLSLAAVLVLMEYAVLSHLFREATP
jgi:exosortase/archaeosortase family protein